MFDNASSVQNQKPKATTKTALALSKIPNGTMARTCPDAGFIPPSFKLQAAVLCAAVGVLLCIRKREACALCVYHTQRPKAPDHRSGCKCSPLTRPESGWRYEQSGWHVSEVSPFLASQMLSPQHGLQTHRKSQQAYRKPSLTQTRGCIQTHTHAHTNTLIPT